MAKPVLIKRDTLRLIVDALYAAHVGGIKSDIEQFVFERCLSRAGGLSRLEKLLSLVPEPKRDTPIDEGEKF